jgi:hypothetical protein
VSRARPIKLPNGLHIASWDPVKEFMKKFRWRRGALFYSDRADFVTAREFTDLWYSDAINRRLGIVKPADRAAALGMDLMELNAFDDKIRELERDVWKKAADFYRGLLASDIFSQTVIVYGGVYHAHLVWSWTEVQAKFGVSRATVFRRMKSGAATADLLRPARAKPRTSKLIFNDRTYTPIEFATAFGISRQHVRDGMARGLSSTQILEAPRRRRGRPRKHALGSGSIIIDELKMPAESVVTPLTMQMSQ